MALDIPVAYVAVLFVKPSGADAVLVSFRLLPPDLHLKFNAEGEDISWLGKKVMNLTAQLRDFSSPLYEGDVTLRADPTWGLSGQSRTARSSSPYLPYSFLGSSPSQYERCKSAGRCARAWTSYEQGTGRATQTEQLFGGGRHRGATL